ncbi:hypothetical protein LWM68_30650 [Niabella sp. W65]|nr:hypothetical protein [Niabella sp. W65]MCH7366735.1 hypothetical protein [Niabella sp. W65]
MQSYIFPNWFFILTLYNEENLFIETPSSAVQHGVGTYAANLIKSMMVYEDCKVYYVQIKFGSSVAFSEVKEKEGFYKILIQFEDPVIKKKQETAIHPLQARVIFVCCRNTLLSRGIIFFI